MTISKKVILIIFISFISFGYGMMSQSWGLFPQPFINKIYWELYAKPEEINSFHVQRNTIQRRTSLYKLSVDRINLPFDSRVERTYGGIDDLYSGILVASNLGDLFFIDGSRKFHKLSMGIPFSRGVFDNLARSRNDVDRYRFGVKDIFVRRESSSTFRVFTSSNHWNPEEQCHTLQFKMAVVRRKGTAQFSLRKDWNTIYETHPCLPLKDESNAFGGLQTGGRIQARSDNEVLLTVGDYEFDGVNGDRQIITDTTTSYGKIIAVNFRTGESSVVSTGHRNPQGLYVDSQDRIWSTEHGPEGGDELNLVESGKNYGWPHVTYGTDYGAYRWPPSDTVGAHSGYERPMYAWLPAIGGSELTGIEGSLFKKWKGDLLISSLKKGTLYRTRIHEGRVIYVEPIQLGRRLRDVIEMKDGTVLIKTANGTLLALRPADQPPA